jgi:hypothetical protein
MLMVAEYKGRADNWPGGLSSSNGNSLLILCREFRGNVIEVTNLSSVAVVKEAQFRKNSLLNSY